MNPSRFPTSKSTPATGQEPPRSPQQYGRPLSLVRKSVLLNLGIVVTALPVLALAGNVQTLIPTLVVLGAISVFIWTATFTTVSLVSVAKIFEVQRTHAATATPAHRNRETTLGVADKWMDSPL